MNDGFQTNGSATFDVGVIHGRFQVLHNDHLKYLLAGKEKRKLGYFSHIGLATHVLWDVPPEKKRLSTADIRMRMLEKSPWTHLVLLAAARLLLDY